MVSYTPQQSSINEYALQDATKPHYLIIGTMKCGTSSLYEYLCKHPQIMPAKTKEVHFFDDNYSKGVEWYLRHFHKISDTQKCLTGEATPKYLNLPGVEQEVFKLVPKVKLIILLRNPWERTISQYYHHIRGTKKDIPLESTLSNQMQLMASLSEEELISGKNSLNFIARSLYVYHLMRWMSVFPREQFLILKSEDFYTNPQQTLNKCNDFLDIDSFTLSDYGIYNSNSYKEIDNGLKNRLRDFFKPHNEKLEKYLDMDFSWE